MDLKKEKEIRARLEPTLKNFKSTVSNVIPVLFCDGESDSNVTESERAQLQFSSLHTYRAIQAINAILADPGDDEFIFNLVVYEVGHDLKVHDIPHARAWLQQKCDLLQSLYDEAVQAHGGKLHW